MSLPVQVEVDCAGVQCTVSMTVQQCRDHEVLFLAKWYKDRTRREILAMMPRLELPKYIIGSLYRSSPCSRAVILYSHCTGPSHHFLEPKDTTRHARMKSTTDTGVRVGPHVFCSTLPSSTTITDSAPIQVCTNNNNF